MSSIRHLPDRREGIDEHSGSDLDGGPDYVAVDLGSSHLGIGAGIGADPDGAAGVGGQRFSLRPCADDCDETADALRTAGVAITAEPTDQPWGGRVARVLDPDRGVVIIGSPPS